MTNSPTNQSATAKLITKQLVTVRKRRVVITANITNVFPNTVISMSDEKNSSKTGWLTDGFFVVGVACVVVS